MAGVGVGLSAASRAIVVDAMYALVEAGMAVAAWLVAGLIGRREDRRFQFGYWHLEPTLGFLSGALGLFAAAYAAADAAGGLLSGGRAASYDIGVAFTFSSAVVSFAAFCYLRRRGKGLDSTLLSMEARAWFHSGLMSAALGSSFGCGRATSWSHRAMIDRLPRSSDAAAPPPAGSRAARESPTHRAVASRPRAGSGAGDSTKHVLCRARGLRHPLHWPCSARSARWDCIILVEEP
ncbi:cation transporter [Roseomonas sp. E05]|uniref:cation transporter n=1 Tax=Roseomonas sp. E05 TaxID=3046310 RepID=UPI0024BA9490|nr:cation transporter [Roseomonas sp. E05]MDJ0390934.1 cation transporter [Roseomonas sp. E05]